MKWSELIDAVGAEPLFESGRLLVGSVDRADIARQLSRWVRTGRLVSLRRGLYAFAGQDAVGRRPVHPYEIANRLVVGSYVSLSSVLGETGLIPEFVPVTTSVTTGRPGMHTTPIGTYLYRHVKASMFWGFERVGLPEGGHGFVATPEKALIDLLYLESDADDPAYLTELRLQNLDRLRLDTLDTMAARCGRKRVIRAVDSIAAVVKEETGHEA